MKPYILTLCILTFLFEIYSVLPFRETSKPAKKGNYVSGIIHVHSLYSDGGGTVLEIAEAAKQAGRDFVVLTDHNVSTARKNGDEKNYNGVDLFVEMEASTQAGHCISFYSHSDAKNYSDVEMNKLSYQHYLDEKTEKDFFIALSHPSNIKNPWLRLDKYGEGYEVMNFDSVWQRELSDNFFGFIGTLLAAPFNSYLASLRFIHFYPKDLTVWDNMNLSANARHFGLLAHDTHSKLKYSKDGFLRWPDYLETFKLGTNLVFLKESLSSDFEQRKKQIYTNIREGHLAMVFDVVHPYDGIDHYMDCGDKKYISGDVVPESSQCQLHLEFPTDFPYERVVRILKDGEIIKETATMDSSFTQKVEGPGTYRTEIWVKRHSRLRIALNHEVPYVFYNPIYRR